MSLFVALKLPQGTIHYSADMLYIFISVRLPNLPFLFGEMR
jgi:hypothetical protein